MPDAAKPALPTFDVPPVNEVAIGVDFAPIQGWNVTHYGLLYKHFIERYPNVLAQPPLPAQMETFGEKPPGFPLSFSFSTAPDTRCWFIDSTDGQLLQVQSDKFLRNWRKRDGSREYPRYKVFRREFMADWKRFLDFVKGLGLPPPQPRQCEILYINHLELGVPLPDMFTFVKAPPRDFLPEPESANFAVSYRIPGILARLHVVLNRAVRIQDGAEVLQFSLTARGQPAGTTPDNLMEWFDVGHEWIIRAFDDLTTTQMHRLWQKRGT
jgi:uncharacterized protein (TIGR04255 family)